MAKPILYYALTNWYYGGFRVVGVTSEKGRQWYGRDQHDQVTHGLFRDILYKFPEGTTWEFAHAACARAEAERECHKAGINAAKRQLYNLEQARNDAVLVAAKGLLV